MVNILLSRVYFTVVQDQTVQDLVVQDLAVPGSGGKGSDMTPHDTRPSLFIFAVLSAVLRSRFQGHRIGRTVIYRIYRRPPVSTG